MTPDRRRVDAPDAPDAPDAKRVLRARARALARVPVQTPLAEAQIEILEFGLAQERYAVETRHVREVYPLADLTPLPCTPAFVLGIVNVRGRILGVLDIKKFFGLPDRGLTDLHRIIRVHALGLEVGLLADEIAGVRSIPSESLQPSLATLTGIRDEYLRGVTSERLVVLDLEHMLADPKLIVHEDVGE